MKVRLAVVLVAVAGAFAAVDLSVLRLFLAAGFTQRPVPVAHLAGVVTHPDPDAARLLDPRLRGGSPIELMRRVMDMVPGPGPDPGDRLADLYRDIQHGGGLLCDGMSRLYFNALVVNGYRARLVDLHRAMLDPWDSHTVVEVYEGGQWHIYDPTFNVAYERDGQLLGAMQIQRSFKDGTFASIHPVFFGSVRYPERIQTYYMNWLPFFNTVYVEDGRQPPRLLGLPPLRYWFGPRFYYSTSSGLSTAHLRLLGTLYLIFVALLPVAVIAHMLGAVVLLGLAWRAQRRARLPAALRPLAAATAVGVA